ncbi:MAG: DoxX family protein [Allorhizobium sp.]
MATIDNLATLDIIALIHNSNHRNNEIPSMPLAISVSAVATWLAAAAFFIGGAVNVSGAKSIRDDFMRYGFPSWWCWITAALEFATACLLLFPATFSIGLALGACVMIAAIAAVLRARDFRHTAPPTVFLLLLIVAGITHL